MAHDLTIVTDFVIASGQSMISTAGVGRLGAAQLTVSTGGTLDLTSGTGLAESSGGGHLTIEADATARVVKYWNDEASYTNEWIASSSGVTTFEVVDLFILRGTGSVLRVDLDAYDVATHGSTLVLVDYGSLLLQNQGAGDNGWGSVELSDGWSADLELSYDLGGGDMGVALTNITAAVPEPSSTALLGVAGLTLGLRRRR